MVTKGPDGQMPGELAEGAGRLRQRCGALTEQVACDQEPCVDPNSHESLSWERSRRAFLSGGAREGDSRHGGEGICRKGTDGQPERAARDQPRHNPTQDTVNRLLRPFTLRLTPCVS